MKVRVKAPYEAKYQTPGACAFDFQSVETITFQPGEFKLIETGMVVETPAGYVLQTQPRSGTFKNFWIMQTNSVGIIDQDYCGENDTIKFPFINMRKEPVTIEAGTRIGQGMFVKIERAEFEMVESMNNADRGGFGSTGQK